MIFGWRRYTIHDGMLRGAYAEWSGREHHAQCTARQYITFELDDPQEICERHLLSENIRCMCGIYVLKGPDMIQDYHNWPAIAMVSAWGAYVEYEYGWRIQHTRLEHIWIEPEWIEFTPDYKSDWDPDALLYEMSARYGVPVEIRRSAVCCGQQHEMAFWPSGKGPISICKMETSHITNCLKYIRRSRRSAASAKWERTFEKELERRTHRRVDGKLMVTF